MMFEEMHTYIDYLKCRILQHFLAKVDARKSDDSNRGCNSISAGPVKCRILQHVLAKLTHFTLARQHPPHVPPTSLASPTNRVTGSKK